MRLRAGIRTLSALVTGAAVTALTAADAAASTAIEYPDNGVAQFSRGGAWLATATDPIAGYFNPAALATQATSFGVGMNLVMQKICFQRKDENGETPRPDPANSFQEYPEEVCNANSGFPRFIPNLAATWRVSDKLGLGLTVTPPSSFGRLEWPEVVTTRDTLLNRDTQVPAPQRFQSLSVQGTILYPTLAFGYEVADGFRIGAGFVSGLVILEIKTASMTTARTSPAADAPPDTKSVLEVKDLFVPGAVAGIHWSATKNIDIAGWYKWFDKIDASGDLTVRAPFYNKNSDAVNPDCKEPGDNEDRGEDCAELTKLEDDAKFGLVIPMEARIGIRWHMPFSKPLPLIERQASRHDTYAVRDPLRDDKYDVELNLTWANNSAADEFTVRFPDGIAVKGAPSGSTVPVNADRPTGFKDSFGARLGGQGNVIRNLLGIRLGTWVETAAVDAEDLNVTGVPALRGGFGGGVVVRIDPVDVELGYQRIWNAGLDNGKACLDEDAVGGGSGPIAEQEGCGRAQAIAGSGAAPDGSIPHRSFHGVNGGKVSQRANVVSIGAVARF